MKQYNLIEKAFLLKKTKLFQNLDLDLLLAIAEKVTQDIYDQKERIFVKDQVANKLYLIAEGEVSLIDKDEKLFALLGPGEFFGDEPLFNYKPRSYSAVCAKDSLIFAISRTSLLTMISECPDIAVSLLEIYSQCLSCRIGKTPCASVQD